MLTTNNAVARTTVELTVQEALDLVAKLSAATARINFSAVASAQATVTLSSIFQDPVDESTQYPGLFYIHVSKG